MSFFASLDAVTTKPKIIFYVLFVLLGVAVFLIAASKGESMSAAVEALALAFAIALVIAGAYAILRRFQSRRLSRLSSFAQTEQKEGGRLACRHSRAVRRFRSLKMGIPAARISCDLSYLRSPSLGAWLACRPGRRATRRFFKWRRCGRRARNHTYFRHFHRDCSVCHQFILVVSICSIARSAVE